MSALLKRVAGVFIAPAEPEFEGGSPGGAATAPRPRPAVWPGSSSTPVGRPGHASPTLDAAEVVEPALSPSDPRAPAVVCPARDVALAGAAVGLALAERRRARCSVVLEWTGEAVREIAPRPAVPAARRCVAVLAGQGVAAVCAGRLVRVALPPEEIAAVATTRRAVAAGAGPPVVLVVGGPRGPALDELLAEQHAILLAARPGADAALLELAAGELEALASPVAAVELAPSPVAVALARAGLALVSPLRGPVLAAL